MAKPFDMSLVQQGPRLPVELAELGNKVEVETPHGRATAQVAEMPFVDPAKEIPKS